MATLLIVEDDKQTNEAICEYLKSAGHKIVPAFDGLEALKIFEQENIDLVVLDIMLPKITGLGVLHELRKKSSVPIIMLTAIEDEYTQVTSFDEQADDYITKPFSMVLLGRRVTYWEKQNPIAQRTFANSPHLFVEKWDTPILCIHGEKDFRILANQAMAAFDAAVMRGVPAELLIYPDENHWVLKPQNGVLWQRTFFEWLDKWLKAPAK